MTHRSAATPPERDDPAAGKNPTEAPHDTTATEPPPDGRTTIAGRYAVDLQSPPETGGISVSYRGRDLRTRDAVTVKTLRIEYRGDPDMRARFRREARLLQFLSHPNVIRALSYAEERGAPWLILESVQGRSLREIIATDAPLSPEAVVPILRGLADALDHLHARGLVHLDVRPENVIVATSRQVKLVDFGLAQTAGTSPESAEGISPDTIAYAAPEQASGDPVATETDVFALGCIVYELLTGQPPFAAASRPATSNEAIRARIEGAVSPLTTASRGALPAWVDDIVLGALDRDPRKRYGSAGSFAALFHSGVEGDVDVETGRPRQQSAAAPGRQFPVNEPGIAMKGSLRLARRRGEAELPADSPHPGALDAAFAPLPRPRVREDPAPGRARGGRLNFDALNRRLWQALMLAAILNLALLAALVLTRGEIPGVWNRSAPVGPGTTVQVAGAGLVARQGPNTAAAIVADLPPGGTVRITGPGVPGEDGLWWPVEVQSPAGPIGGYVPETWLQAP